MARSAENGVLRAITLLAMGIVCETPPQGVTHPALFCRPRGLQWRVMTKAEQSRLTTWRLRVLRWARKGPHNVARTCRHFGISRKTFYKWKRRHDVHGDGGLCDRPRGGGQ